MLSICKVQRNKQSREDLRLHLVCAQWPGNAAQRRTETKCECGGRGTTRRMTSGAQLSVRRTKNTYSCVDRFSNRRLTARVARDARQTSSAVGTAFWLSPAAPGSARTPSQAKLRECDLLFCPEDGRKVLRNADTYTRLEGVALFDSLCASPSFWPSLFAGMRLATHLRAVYCSKLYD
jgi:hypothetical protein